MRIPFVVKERLRNETGHGAEVVVRIVEPLRVELDLAVVEVDVRRVREAIAIARISAYVRQCHWNLKVISVENGIQSHS